MASHAFGRAFLPVGGGGASARVVSRFGMAELCSFRRARREGGKEEHQSSEVAVSTRRVLLLALGLPLARSAGGATAASCAHMGAVTGLAKEGGVEHGEEDFGFDGLGKASEEYVPGKIVALAQAGDEALLFVGVDGFQLPLQLVVGPAEAMAVLTAVQDRKTRRPVTHEAWGLSLAAVGWKVDRVAITANENDVFYSRVILSSPTALLKSIDVRPSDGIALALRCRAPLFISRKVAEKILGPSTEQAGKQLEPDPLKRPSLQASTDWSTYVDNIASSLPQRDSKSPIMLFMDEEISHLLGTCVKVLI